MAEIVPTPDPVAPGTPLAEIAPPPEEGYIEGDHPTDNPDGVTVSNHDYWPKTQEEKAEGLMVTMVEPVEVTELEPYPEGNPISSEDERLEYLSRMHSPMELVQADDMAEQAERNLRAGGSVEMKDVKAITNDGAERDQPPDGRGTDDSTETEAGEPL